MILVLVAFTVACDEKLKHSLLWELQRVSKAANNLLDSNRSGYSLPCLPLVRVPLKPVGLLKNEESVKPAKPSAELKH